MEHIETCPKKKFKPSPQMIEEAFQNILENKNRATKEETPVRSKSKNKKGLSSSKKKL